MCSWYPRDTDCQIEDTRAPERMVLHRQCGGARQLEIAGSAADLGRRPNAHCAVDLWEPDTFDGIETSMGGHDEKHRRLRLPHWPGHDLGA